ncbi:hypothetical protein V6N13_060975 [Hibiscus sabdariffa]|uniref:Uncharacterized protein n=1 Tax=Hibiscus sabdariffa TaxID=183260 RepID=A0ABR2N8U9_9ROSI
MLGNPWLSFRVEPGEVRHWRAKARFLDTSGKPGQNQRASFPACCFSVITSSDLRQLAETYHKVGMLPPQHERTISELVRNEHHYPSPDPAKFCSSQQLGAC